MPDVSGVIAQMFIYPVKSCGGLSVDHARLTATGLAHDRDWMIVDQDGLFLTQRQVPHLCWISPQIGTETLSLDAPGVGSVQVPLIADGPRRTVRVWRDTVEAIDMGPESGQWLDEYLQIPGKHFSLVRYSPQGVRTSDLAWTDGIAYPNHFSDGFALHVLSHQALVELNERLAEQGHDPVDILRFRPNLVVEGIDAHEEDALANLVIQCAATQAEIELVKPCPRCPIPNIDPHTAMSSPEVGQTLASYRALPRMDSAICFGMNGVVKSGLGEVLHVGQAFDGRYRF